MTNNNVTHTDNINKLTGLLLREYRREAGLSGCELADMCGISQQQVSRYERGVTQITIEALMMFCTVLEIDLTVFARKLLDRCQPEQDEHAADAIRYSTDSLTAGFGSL